MMRPVEAGEARVEQDRDKAGEPGGRVSPAAPGPGAKPESRAGTDGEPSAAERRARALRDNLHRRKAQARARKSGPSGESPPGD